MKNRVQTLGGFQKFTEYNRSSGLLTTTYIPRTAWTENFRVINGGQTHGDRKSPYPIEFDHEIRTTLVGNSTGSNATHDLEWSGNYFGIMAPWPTISFGGWYPPGLYNDALSAVNSQIRSDLDLSIDAFQAKQTASLFRNARRYIDYVRLVRHGGAGLKQMWKDYNHTGKQFSDRVDRSHEPGLKRLGSKWLEFQYGAKPLAQDVYESVHNVFKRVPQLLVAEARRKEVLVGSGKQGVPANGGQVEEFRYEQANRVHMHILYAPSSSTLSEISQFTSLNPVSIAWELMPWSFVVDWFYDIGGYIRNVETCLLSGNQFKNGYVTEGHRFYSTHEWRSPSNSRNWYEGSQQYTRKKRTVLLSHPAPRLPRFQADLGSQRMLNAAALLSQFLGKKPRPQYPVKFDGTKPVSYFNWGLDRRP